MKTIARTTSIGRKIALCLVGAAGFVVVTGCLATAQSLPQVHLDADALAPRPIEQLTKATITRHYARAWRDLAYALESGQAGALGEEFVGFDKDRLLRKIAEQKGAGLHVRIVDKGHQLTAVYYSADGTAMQLFDRAQLEIQTFDGSKLLDKEDATHAYVVIMTPGADRWYVRDLQEISVKSL